MKDMKTVIGATQSLAPAARTATAHGTAQDLQGFNGALFVFSFGAITDGTHTPLPEESDDNVTFTTVDPSDLVGTLVAGAANTCQRASYIGAKRYIKASMTVAGATTGALSSSEILPGHAAQNPVA